MHLKIILLTFCIIKSDSQIVRSKQDTFSLTSSEYNSLFDSSKHTIFEDLYGAQCVFKCVADTSYNIHLAVFSETSKRCVCIEESIVYSTGTCDADGCGSVGDGNGGRTEVVSSVVVRIGKM